MTKNFYFRVNFPFIVYIIVWIANDEREQFLVEHCTIVSLSLCLCVWASVCVREALRTEYVLIEECQAGTRLYKHPETVSMAFSAHNVTPTQLRMLCFPVEVFVSYQCQSSKGFTKSVNVVNRLVMVIYD